MIGPGQAPDGIGTNTVDGGAQNVVQAGAIYGGVVVNPHPSGHDLCDLAARSQVESSGAHRHLEAVFKQLAQVQQQLVDSVRAERNITQVVMALQLMLMRLQDLITQLTWERDNYRHQAGGHAAELTRTRNQLGDAHRSQERTQYQLDRALDERTVAVELIAVLQRKVNALERRRREVDAVADPSGGVLVAKPLENGQPYISVGVDLDEVDLTLDRIGTYLDEQDEGLSRITALIEPSGDLLGVPPDSGQSPPTLLRQPATHDELTGLLNRHGVMKLLRKMISSRGPSARVVVLLCDIDNFKRINDSLGHDAGDDLLIALAARLADGLPEDCTVARLAGDEYAIVCSDIDAVGRVGALTNWASVLLTTPIPVRGQMVRVTTSIGVAISEGPTTGSDLLRFADAAVFEAKKRGAGRVTVASEALMAAAGSQVHLEGELREVLAEDGLVLHFQPVVDADGAIQTAEALVRWPHPDRGLLMPGVFLPVAEGGGLLRELDCWVLRTALREAVKWPDAIGGPLAVAVNLSGFLPGDPEFVDIVTDAVVGADIAWERVVLELVETSLVDLPSQTRSAMVELVGRGVRFAVDDFGTGYSSLARLKDLPAQIIKLDRRFVAGVSTDSADFAVASAVVDLSRAMGRDCVAEGVETADQFHALRGMGVDSYQGWLFAHAVPIPEFRALLRQDHLTVPAPNRA
jgi:diguanylate cyclase (GGDEF)-like protein